MQKHTELTRQRLKAFIPQLTQLLYTQHTPVNLTVFSAPGRITYADAMKGQYRPARIGEKFGPLWSTHWFCVEIEQPTDWAGHEVHLLWDSASEACVWQAGQPLQGLTGSYSSWADEAIRKEFRLSSDARTTLYVEVACNGLFGLRMDAYNQHIGLLRQAEIALFNRQAWDLLWDFTIVSDMAEHLPANTPRAGQALYAGNAMVNVIRLDDPNTWQTAREIAAQYFAAHNGEGQHNLSAIGHAHIDTAWLWPLAETRRKCARSFASALRYMEDYPDYKFACSQAQQYEWMKNSYPALYSRIKERVAEERFIPVGGTWVEPDCNIPSGESLVRQFLYGQRFFEAEFGTRCIEFWNPDVFGYSAALPQIMRQAGIRYFLTQKLSWNQFNKPASHTFMWEGLDGSQVLTHFPPADTYNATATVKEVLYNVSNFKDHERANESFLLFGYGDGGGGPTPAMLERIERMADVDGLPRTRIRSPQEFFSRCEADAKDLTVWVGELYFELHRGTYTTQARNKRDNRLSEGLLHDVEFLSAIAHATRRTPYPAQALAGLWKRVLTNQFHDIIPGSSITEVYEDSAIDYADILEQAAALRGNVLSMLAGNAVDESAKVCVVNTIGMARTELVGLPGTLASAQMSADGQPLGVVSVPAFGYRITTPDTTVSDPASITETAVGIVLENMFVRAQFSMEGALMSLFDKRAERECIEPGHRANQLVLFDDQPNNWEAWDVDAFHLENRLAEPRAHAVRITERGPLRVTVEFDYHLSPDSRLTQTISVTAISARLDFTNIVDWNESRKFLKVEFPLNLRAAQATYEIQFGHVQRPTHFNTSWDLARFEVCAHKWADLAEPDFGVALLNDCKYGYATHGNVMRLSLLRAPKNPDPQADMGEHPFRYALLPHLGNFQDAGVVAEGYRFNLPLVVLPSRSEAAEVSYFSVDSPSVVVDTVKKAEDSDALIVRLFEAHGTRSTIRLMSTLGITDAWKCNLLEDGEDKLEWHEGGVTMQVAPFQIVTLKLELA